MEKLHRAWELLRYVKKSKCVEVLVSRKTVMDQKLASEVQKEATDNEGRTSPEKQLILKDAAASSEEVLRNYLWQILNSLNLEIPVDCFLMTFKREGHGERSWIDLRSMSPSDLKDILTDDSNTDYHISLRIKPFDPSWGTLIEMENQLP